MKEHEEYAQGKLEPGVVCEPVSDGGSKKATGGVCAGTALGCRGGGEKIKQ